MSWNLANIHGITAEDGLTRWGEDLERRLNRQRPTWRASDVPSRTISCPHKEATCPGEQCLSWEEDGWSVWHLGKVIFSKSQCITKGPGWFTVPSSWWEFPKTKNTVTLMKVSPVSLKVELCVDTVDSHFSNRKITLQGRTVHKIIFRCTRMGLWKSPHSHHSPQAPTDGWRWCSEKSKWLPHTLPLRWHSYVTPTSGLPCWAPDLII